MRPGQWQIITWYDQPYISGRLYKREVFVYKSHRYYNALEVFPPTGRSPNALVEKARKGKVAYRSVGYDLAAVVEGAIDSAGRTYRFHGEVPI